MQTTTNICPLCRMPNDCAMAAGNAAAQCWCMAQSVSRAALERLPKSERGLSCICPACAATASGATIIADDTITKDTPCPPTTSK